MELPGLEHVGQKMSDSPHCTSLTVWRARIPFRFAFSHNLASRTGADTLLIEATDSAGRTGFGQVLTRDYLTGEARERTTYEDLRQALEV